ncbi:NUDIX hydrolase [Leptobacterium sp. I13]|uniref:NUDIX hydrolase n=1 Tax=Leptobacterium meishanense TaxID=3128904 RepID=UPI0030EF42CC
MYEVFVNDHRIVLTNKLVKESGFKLFLFETVNMEEVIRQLTKKEIRAAYLYHLDASQLLPILKKKMSLVVAAGGLVLNKEKEVLFIFRNGKWDLPKGKVDKGETLEKAAIREVEEETGVKKLVIDNFLARTYHIFKRNGKYKLKETHWFTMKTEYRGELVAECEEGIEHVEWKSATQIPEALKNSYQNIKSLLKDY